MKRIAVVGLTALAAGSALALDLTKYSDLAFAEKYAFSTNREALVNAELKYNTGPWYFYTLLNLQTSGRYDEAKDFVNKARRDNETGTQQAWDDLQVRQKFCDFDAAREKPRDGGRTPDEFLVYDLTHPGLGGIVAPAYAREVPLKPNTYPTALDPEKITFEKFRSDLSGGRNLAFGLEDRFAFLAYAPKSRFSPSACNLLIDRSYPSGAPGFFEAVVADLRGNNLSLRKPAFKSLTIEQLTALQQALADDPNRNLANDDAYAFVQVMTERLSARVEGEDELETAKRMLSFARTLPRTRDCVKLQALRLVLELSAARGDYSQKELLKELVTMTTGSHDHSTAEFRAWWQKKGNEPLHSFSRRELGLVSEPASWRHATLKVVCDYLAAWRRAGENLDEWSEFIARGVIDRVIAETDLLAGKDPTAVKTSVLTDDEYRRLRDRVDLVWSKANPRTFAADDDVALAIDVKNVKKMRLAIYDLDPLEVLAKSGGKEKDDLDLDGCVPTAERTLDFTRHPSLVRHAERLALPELKRPGLYVVECSGGGRSSRAVVRKGRLRVTHRLGAGGYVFTCFDEHGHVAKPSVLRLGPTAFTSDENGEIAVPFASDVRTAGEKTVFVGAGRLAASRTFNQNVESYEFRLTGVLPQEGVVAGREATLLCRPELLVSGVRASVGLLKDVKLTLTLTDADGVTSVKTTEGYSLADDAEAVCRFVVPARLASVTVSLAATVRNVSRGKDESLAATCSLPFNGIVRTSTVQQAFLRRGSDGYRLELKGRNGEPLAARHVRLRLKHRCFKATQAFDLQTDAAGRVGLGALNDIVKVWLEDGAVRKVGALDGVINELEELEGRAVRSGRSWDLAGEELPLPSALSAADGEPIELPGRGVLSGSWPYADELTARLSLVAKNAAGKVIADRTKAIAVTNGVVRIAGLAAGEYDLWYVAEGKTVRLTVVKPAGERVEGGTLVGAACGVTDTGAPRTMRVDSARVEKGRLVVRLAGATDEARVHVFARRLTPDATDRAASAFAALAEASVERPEFVRWSWGDQPNRYISGRDLGDKIRYVLDRRNQPHRPGNLLERPSLLLNPWSARETVNREIETRSGEGWAEAECAADSAPRSERRMFGGNRYLSAGDSTSETCPDFLAAAAPMWANLRPDKDGVVTLPLTDAARQCQELCVMAFDGRGADMATVRGRTEPLVCRDLRMRDGGKPSVATRTYATVGDLYGLMAAICRGDEDLAAFSFVAKWATLGEARKRELYDAYASHELDVFTYFKDRPFFDAVVRPHLANKRFKQFTDLWLLGADLADYASPGRLQELNGFEQCLLAQRLPALKPVIARAFAEHCAAHPVTAEAEDALWNQALGLREQREFACNACFGAAPPLCEEEVECEEEGDDDFGGWSNQRKMAPQQKLNVRQMEALGLMSSARRARGGAKEKRAVDAKRRESRQLYRPPARTREWVETHHYRRPHADRVGIAANPFWRDYAAAVAAGSNTVRSLNAVHAAGGFAEAMAALAVSDLPFAVKPGEGLVYREREPEASGLTVLRRFVNPEAAARGSGDELQWSEAFVTNEFVVGHTYGQLTVVMNPSERTRRVKIVRSIPAGAIPLGESKANAIATLTVKGYSVEHLGDYFYFPAVVTGGVLRVVAEPTTVDRTSWRWVSQNGTSEEVLAMLRTVNLRSPAIDLGKIGWRMKDAGFRAKALAELDARGVFHEGLWTTVLQGRYGVSENVDRVRQLLSSRGVQEKLKKWLGPSFISSLITIDPEVTDVFEHKEYWPLVNARAHTLGGTATIANEGLKATYRAFLDVLATKPALTARDRLLAAVYLLAQDRVDEAKEQVRAVKADDVETKLQLDYLNAYLAFCDLKPEDGRRIAAKYADWPVRRWRDRFREIVAQADEIAGKGSAFDAEGGEAAERTPTLALSAAAGGELAIRSENVASCVVKAYPTDVEMTFSKNPFGEASVSDAATLLRPVWQVTYEPGRGRKLTLPKELLRENLIVEAEDAEGRARARLTLLAGALDVQVAEERGRLRVRDAKGRPLAAAYVKVYARDERGAEVKFHKDGYTDLRGVFDYASVSTDSEFKPAAFAVLVLREDVGVKTLTVKCP